jgi:hypothetical protein
MTNFLLKILPVAQKVRKMPAIFPRQKSSQKKRNDADNERVSFHQQMKQKKVDDNRRKNRQAERNVLI